MRTSMPFECPVTEPAPNGMLTSRLSPVEGGQVCRLGRSTVDRALPTPDRAIGRVGRRLPQRWRSSTETGKFGRLFRGLTPLQLDESQIQNIVNTMIDPGDSAEQGGWSGTRPTQLLMLAPIDGLFYNRGTICGHPPQTN